MTPAVLLLAAMIQDPAVPSTAERAQGTTVAAQEWVAKGLVLYKRLRFRAAAREFEQAVEADPGSAAAHFYLGYTLYKIGEPTRRMTPEKQRSREHFARCFELDPAFRPDWAPRQ
jgi:tetratricopeptide (TPR) repeat protein